MRMRTEIGNEGLLPLPRLCLAVARSAAIVALTGALLISCTTAGSERSPADRPSKFARFQHDAASSDCFFQRSIDNFEVLDESNLLVFDGRRRTYHVEVSPPSMSLRHAYGLQFRSTTGRICGNPGERLQISDGSFDRFPISVTGVYRLDEATQAAVRAHFGQTTPLPVPPEDEEAEAIEELVTDIEEEAAAEPSGENQEN